MDMIDYSLYLVTDRGLCLGRNLLDVVAAAVQGGVTLVQLREKNCETREFVELARALKKLLAPTGTPLLINDRVDVALACDAEGVHVGQTDMLIKDVRALIGPDKIVGLSVDSEDDIYAACDQPVNYIGVGPVYPTQTKKTNCLPWGLEGLKKARTIWKKPLIAIGSVNHSNACQVMACNVDGIAVVSALCSAPDVQKAAKELKALL